jgi:DNA-binding response OmpR family regulator
MRILHIEDSREISAIFSDILKIANHDFESTIDGREGLELVLKNNYDIILLDIGLPHYTGFDFLVDLKINKASEIRKVIVVTSLQLEEYQTQFLMNLGVHSIQQKPISVQHLLSKLIPKMAP